MKRLTFFLAIILLFSFSLAFAEEWVCSVCGKTNTTNFCTSCGTKHDPWICPTCGAENYDAFCGSCGTAQPMDISALYGIWKLKYDGETICLEIGEDGTVFIVTDDGSVVSGTYKATTDQITMSYTTGVIKSFRYSISDDKLSIEEFPLFLTKTNEPITFKLTMDGESMLDTIQSGTTLYFQHLKTIDIQRFDIVAVNYPERDAIFIKRIIGLPGDVIELKGSYLYINDVKYDEPYINDEYRSGSLNTFGPYEVPEGRYFVLGDHRNNSNDSRFIGPLDAGMILGIRIPQPGLPIMEGYISGFSWYRGIDVLKRADSSESGWELPSEATLSEEKVEIHHYDSVVDHYEEVEVQRSRQILDHYETSLKDNDNGTFTEISTPVYRTEYYTEIEQQPVYKQVPKYETKYYYTVPKWVYSHTVELSGTDHNPIWPDVSLAQDEKEDSRTEYYILTLTDGENAKEFYTSKEYWDTISLNEEIYITMQLDSGDYCISDCYGSPIASIYAYENITQ